MTLQTNTTLQGGKYRILSVLGQGGFGITYLAEQTLLDGKVAIKEFFMKELCERDESTSHVTLGTSNNREMVEKCRQKFLKEARTIFKLDHPNIVHIHDVFEENGTAYYVMDYIEGESLADMVKRRGALPEAEALNYIKEVGKALMYIHEKKINHLDIKPSNIMRRDDDGRIMLIDFGVSKQYDLVTSEGTSTTPVGISRGYSPAEQYRQHGVQTFSPQSDVYALAATLYKLLTGVTPPEAMEVQDDGLPLSGLQSRHISSSVIDAIQRAMKGRRERTQSIAAFLSELGDAPLSKNEDTMVVNDKGGDVDRENIQEQQSNPTSLEDVKGPQSNHFSILKILLGIASILIIGVFVLLWGRNGSHNGPKLAIQGANSDTMETLLLVQNDTIDMSPNNENAPNRQTFTVNGVSFAMILVEGGTFMMGATEEQGNDAYKNEKPVHEVSLSSFRIGETEVTQELWQAVMGNNPSYFKGLNRPVEVVSWNDCQRFIRKLNEATTMNFRMPTEAEWEYAARGGSQSRGYKYSGSNDIDSVAWYKENSDGKTHDVATKQCNELGIFDMSGNVCEWCSDRYNESANFYVNSPRDNPQGLKKGDHRVERGGSCHLEDYLCRTASRLFYWPGFNNNSGLGLRLALSE